MDGISPDIVGFCYNKTNLEVYNKSYVLIWTVFAFKMYLSYYVGLR
ncbi:hypothetical protein SAMN05444274_10324 [Mariniphaga anaerophila]|uniref:Uncharacterized protein n=1 Tax=Mariniphaga anaerophila TaxID=1484053 RepID=A0A1M4XJL5_9BACT|nr:hypothetical protein SAMN05444274_10324 [Mariniphaga anaerophila]